MRCWWEITGKQGIVKQGTCEQGKGKQGTVMQGTCEQGKGMQGNFCTLYSIHMRFLVYSMNKTGGRRKLFITRASAAS